MKIGDKAAVLDENINGTIIDITQNKITLLTSDDFEMEFLPKEIVILNNSVSKREMGHMNIEQVLSQKTEIKRKTNILEKPKKKQIPAMEVDLHINQLVRSTKFLQKHDMLNIQLDTAQRQLEFAISKRIQRVIFIHGIGEGILRAELETLFRRYENVKFYDADYQKYGRGATEVYIFQNPINQSKDLLHEL